MDESAATIVDIRRVIDLLANRCDDPAAARLAVALQRWLQASARAAALDGLVALHGDDLDDLGLATLIVDGLEQLKTHALPTRRPDRTAGYVVDLARAGCAYSARHWRRLVGAARGQRSAVLATAGMTIWSASKRRSELGKNSNANNPRAARQRPPDRRSERNPEDAQERTR